MAKLVFPLWIFEENLGPTGEAFKDLLSRLLTEPFQENLLVSCLLSLDLLRTEGVGFLKFLKTSSSSMSFLTYFSLLM